MYIDILFYSDGRTMGDTCNKLLEPEDVSVAATVGMCIYNYIYNINIRVYTCIYVHVYV